MTNQQRIYLIILQRRIASMEDLQQITNWKPITVLRAVAPLIITKKLKAVKHDKIRYFAINQSPL